MFRVSLAGMWRPAARLAFLAELRSEDAQRVIPYALYVRVRPWKGRPLDIQAGRIPPVFGAFARRSYGARQSADRLSPRLPVPDLASGPTPCRSPPTICWRCGRAAGGRAIPSARPSPAPGVPLVSAYRWDTGVQARATAGRVEGAIAVTSGHPLEPARGRRQPRTAGVGPRRLEAARRAGARRVRGARPVPDQDARGRRGGAHHGGRDTSSARWGSTRSIPAATGLSAAR